jgi:hypothetical protein
METIRAPMYMQQQLQMLQKATQMHLKLVPFGILDLVVEEKEEAEEILHFHFSVLHSHFPVLHSHFPFLHSRLPFLHSRFPFLRLLGGFAYVKYRV